jgi:hypothetical protein
MTAASSVIVSTARAFGGQLIEVVAVSLSLMEHEIEGLADGSQVVNLGGDFGVYINTRFQAAHGPILARK